jgi:processive 1,2-diacylglycerol beta-glucosyltransferase
MGTGATTRPKILILTVRHGASHRRVASALQQGLLGVKPDLTVEVVDGLTHCARWFRGYYDAYVIPLKYWPSLWGWIESIQHTSKATGPLWLHRRGAQPLFRFIRAFNPDIVVATEVGMCELAAMLKRETQARYCLVGLPTGVDVDRPWAQPEVDLYLAGPGEATAQLEAVGVPLGKIVPCGTPVDPAFSQTLDQETARTRLGITGDVPMLLVLFGGAGYGKPEHILPELRKISRPLRVIFVTGRNQRLEKQLRRECEGRSSWRVFGWVDNMHEWMAAADLLLSKPGGGTLIEALNSGLPVLGFDPLPGLERRTCDLIERWQTGLWIRRAADLAPAITRLLNNPEQLAALRRNALSRAQPHAARDAALTILKRWESGN